MKSLLTNTFEKICRLGMNNRADFLKITCVTGLILSCLAQTCAIIFNPKIEKKEKNFLIPQELADGVLNSGLFWFFTSNASDIAKKLVLTKKIMPTGLENIFKNFQQKGKNIQEMEKSFLNFLEKSGDINAMKAGKTLLGGAGLIGMFLGSIISVNIITPLIRNKIASKIQQTRMNKLNIYDDKTFLYNRLKNLDYSKFNKTFAYTKNNVCSYNPNIKI